MGVSLPTAEAPFPFRLDRAKLRDVSRGEGTYLLRTNLPPENPEDLWKLYITLKEVEQAFGETFGVKPQQNRWFMPRTEKVGLNSRAVPTANRTARASPPSVLFPGTHLPPCPARR